LDYNEVGVSYAMSNKIETLWDLVVGDIIEFRLAMSEDFFPANAIKAFESYFVEALDGETTTTINIVNTYNLSTNKLDVYRDGLIMFIDESIGDVTERYAEDLTDQIELESTAIALEVFTFVNDEEVPNFKVVYTGLIGAVLTIPEYTMGTDALRVFRNGELMNSAGLGAAIDKYAETDSTSITLVSAAVPSDVFVIIEKGAAPTFREDITGTTGFTVTMVGIYSMGSDELLVFKNGILMFNSAVLGSAAERYQEATNKTITLEVAAIASDVWTFINK
jgi:hypothetical protein